MHPVQVKTPNHSLLEWEISHPNHFQIENISHTELKIEALRYEGNTENESLIQ